MEFTRSYTANDTQTPHNEARKTQIQSHDRTQLLHSNFPIDLECFTLARWTPSHNRFTRSWLWFWLDYVFYVSRAALISLWHLNLNNYAKTESVQRSFHLMNFYLIFSSLSFAVAAVGSNCRPTFVNVLRQMPVLSAVWVRYHRWSIWSRAGAMHRSRKTSTAHQIRFDAIIWTQAIRIVCTRAMHWTNWLAHWPTN